MKTELLLDYQTILANQARPIHFALRFTADPVKLKDRQPLAFCIVLDRSGSMAGQPLHHALLATRTAIRNLRTEDRFSLVAFDCTAQTVIPLQSAARRGDWEQRVAQIEAGDSTNLTGGWMLGAEQLAGAPAGIPRRLLLLSDGHLNNGIVEPSQVKGIVASGLEARGIRTTCLGFGRGYDEVLLSELAKATNGEFYDADSPERLPAIFEHELQGLQSVSVQNLRVRLKRLDFCEAIAALNEYPCVELPDGRWEYAVGDLVSEEERVAVFALQVLPLPAIDGTPVTSLAGELLLEVELAYDEITAEGIASRTVTQVVRGQSTQEPAEVKVNETVLSWVAVQQAAQALRESTRLAREGDLVGAKASLSYSRRAMFAAPNPEAMKAGIELLEKAEAELAPTNLDQVMAMKKMHAMRHRAVRASSRPEPTNESNLPGDPQP